LNYEKRAPFPTINLLRADKIRKYADEMKTSKISDSNKISLESVPPDRLKLEFENIIKIALE
jgi:hypothetical protein